MADPANWKAKYIEVSREYEERERAWLELEKILRRLIGKLCAVGMGADERLDLHLTTVAKVSRGNSTVVELQALSDSLSDAVLALEKSAAPQSQLPGLISAPAGPELKQASSASQLRQNLRSSAPRSAQGNTGSLDTIGESIASVLELLEQLSAMDPTNPRAASLAVQLDLVTDDQQFAAVLTDVTELVREHAQSASRDRHDAAAMLAQISNRLAEMAAYLCSSRDENAQTQRDLTELNIEVHDEVGEISRQANSIADLASLRALISERLETVASRVREFRTRQEDRFRANAVRIERLRARITELESETTRLHRGLAEERDHPRTDLLTGLENKTTFEARLTESIVRRKQAAAPLTLLIWDIDFF